MELLNILFSITTGPFALILFFGLIALAVTTKPEKAAKAFSDRRDQAKTNHLNTLLTQNLFL